MHGVTKLETQTMNDGYFTEIKQSTESFKFLTPKVSANHMARHENPRYVMAVLLDKLMYDFQQTNTESDLLENF